MTTLTHHRPDSDRELRLTAPVIDHPEAPALIDRLAKWQRLFSPNAEPYRLAGYEDLYADAEGLLVYDNFAPGDSRFVGFDRYRKTWELSINRDFPGFVMEGIVVDRLHIADDFATVAFTWTGDVQGEDGTSRVPAAQHATHIWQKSVDGLWRITLEHLTGGVKINGRPYGEAVEARRPAALDAAQSV
ncbi:MAG: hypothetical protein AAF333_11140 [Planctomycetota bacterium]